MASDTPIQVLLIIYPTFNTLDLNGPLDVIRNAAIRADSGLYPFKTDAFEITITAADVLTTSYEGVVIQRDISLTEACARLSDFDVLVQTGGLGSGIKPHLNVDDEIIKLIQEFSTLGVSERLGDLRIMLSICTGALFFGYAGIFAGLNATTHYLSLQDLQTICNGFNIRAPGSKVTTVLPSPPDQNFRYVKVTVNPEETARVISSGGISCGIDATLYLVELLKGRDLALAVQNVMEYAWREM